MAALRKSGAAGYHKSKKINQIRKQKHKKRLFSGASVGEGRPTKPHIQKGVPENSL
jgi:hypothetical protein